MDNRAEIVICGAGIAGVAAAWHLAVRHGVRGVVLIDEREPLTLTSDKGTQGYRNWWPGPDDTMLRLVSRSIDLLEEMADQTNNLFRLNRRGYLFVTAQESAIEGLRDAAREVSGYGMGDVREHRDAREYRAGPLEGYRNQPTGADLLLGDAALGAFPFLARDTMAALHVRRAGWMNAVALGAWMFRQAVGAGVTFVRGRVESIESNGGRVTAVGLASGSSISTGRVVLAAGPLLPQAGRMLGVELPLFHELHAKVTFADHLGVIPRSSPFTIRVDPVELDGFAGGRTSFPGGVHFRPIDGPRGNELFLIWTYHTERCDAIWPPPYDPHYADICLRGLASMVPGMASYVDAPDRGYVDGGYYCKTTDNRPLIGPLAIEGAHVIGALSGSGIMAAHAAADLLAAHLTGSTLPDYANAFLPSRYDDIAYREQVERWGALTGQL